MSLVQVAGKWIVRWRTPDTIMQEREFDTWGEAEVFAVRHGISCEAGTLNANDVLREHGEEELRRQIDNAQVLHKRDVTH